MKLEQLQSVIGGRLTADARFDGVSQNVDDAKAGMLFVCLKGLHYDTHNDGEQLVQKGVAAIVCEHALAVNLPQLIVPDTRAVLGRIASAVYGDPSGKLRLIGVTGTNGKTSIAYALRLVFAKAGYASAYIGTLGVITPWKQEDGELTTPDPVPLQRMLYEMVQHKIQYVFMEVSAHAAYWHKVSGCRFAAMLFSNLSQDHLDFFGDMRRYEQAKMSLFDWSYTNLGIVNADDETGRKLLASAAIPMLSYGLNNPCDVFAVSIADRPSGMRFTVNAYDVLFNVTTRLHGRFNVYNVLAMAACSGYFGIEPGVLCQVLRTLNIPGRFNVIEKNGVRLVVDYAHTPDGLQNCLQACRALTTGRLLCVFGCGGERDKDKRAKMGAVAEQWSDHAYITNDNARREDPMAIAAAITEGMSHAAYTICLDRAAAIRAAFAAADVGDCILIAGKGAEKYMEQNGTRIAYSDYKVIEEL